MMPPRLPALLILSALLLVPIGQPGATGELPASDGALEREVRQILDRVQALRSLKVQIQVEAGVVGITGRVPSLALRRRLVHRIAAIRGVLDVEAELSIPRRPGGDRALLGKVEDRLSLHLDLRRLTVTVERGVCQAAGTVDTPGRLLYLQAALEEIAGLQRIDLGRVNVQSLVKHARDGDEMAGIVLRLLRDPHQFPVAGRIGVRFDGESVILDGVVPRLIDRLEANLVTRLVTGDLPVKNKLVIDPHMGRLRVVEPR